MRPRFADDIQLFLGNEERSNRTSGQNPFPCSSIAMSPESYCTSFTLPIYIATLLANMETVVETSDILKTSRKCEFVINLIRRSEGVVIGKSMDMILIL